MRMYHPKNHDMIDAPMLAKYLTWLDTNLSHHCKLCLVGGSALTILGVREAGSEDIDFVYIGHAQYDVERAKERVEQAMREHKVGIQITREGHQAFYEIPHAKPVQLFGRRLSKITLPDDFEHYMHRIKKVLWVKPAKGRVEHLPTHMILNKIQLFTLGPHDMFCSKLFLAREKDMHDLRQLLHETPLFTQFFRSRKRMLLNRFISFSKANRGEQDVLESGVRFYEYLQRKEARFLEPLPASYYQEMKLTPRNDM